MKLQTTPGKNHNYFLGILPINCTISTPGTEAVDQQDIVLL